MPTPAIFALFQKIFEHFDVRNFPLVPLKDRAFQQIVYGNVAATAVPAHNRGEVREKISINFS
jgi:hypothetical protein